MAEAQSVPLDLASRIASLWAEGRDSADIAAVVGMPEADVERIRCRQRALVTEAQVARRASEWGA